MARRMSNLPRNVPTKPVLAGLEWFEQYNCFTTVLNGWLKLSFEYDGDGYKIQVAEKTLQARAKTPEDAAATAVKAARIWVLRIVEKIDEVQKTLDEKKEANETTS